MWKEERQWVRSTNPKPIKILGQVSIQAIRTNLSRTKQTVRLEPLKGLNSGQKRPKRNCLDLATIWSLTVLLERVSKAQLLWAQSTGKLRMKTRGLVSIKTNKRKPLDPCLAMAKLALENDRICLISISRPMSHSQGLANTLSLTVPSAIPRGWPCSKVDAKKLVMKTLVQVSTANQVELWLIWKLHPQDLVQQSAQTSGKRTLRMINLGQEITLTRPTLLARQPEVLQLWEASTSQRLIQTLALVNTQANLSWHKSNLQLALCHRHRDKTCGKIRLMINQDRAITPTTPVHLMIKRELQTWVQSSSLKLTITQVQDTTQQTTQRSRLRLKVQ